ncbi:MAG: PAS domain S-box protein [Chloroflexi bacterium]|nr:PAS domain S-box protein [Chloroflexota bacterium]
MSAFKNLIRNHNISLLEVEALLNICEYACALVDQDDEIVLVNSAFIELTAFTREEILKTPIQSMIISKRTDNGMLTQSIVRKNRTALEINLQKEILDDKQNWKLFIILQKSPTAGTNYVDLQTYLNSYAALIETSERTFRQFCQKGLEILERVFHFDLLGIYFQIEEGYQVDRDLSRPLLHMPDFFSFLETKSLSDYSVWTQGTRTINVLQRSAREQQLNTLIARRIVATDDQDGFLLAGWKELVKDPTLLAIVESYMQLFQYGTSLYQKEQIQNAVQQEDHTKAEIIKNLQDNVEEGIVFVSHEKDILSINQTMERLLGYSKWEVQDLSMDDYLVCSPHVSDLFAVTFNKREEKIEENCSLHRRDGSEEVVKIRVIPVDKTDARSAFVIFIRSTREMDGLRKTVKDFEHQAALGKSVATFAHEVRNPINNMVTGLQVLQNLANGEETQLDIINRMMNDCVRLNHLMDSILSYAKPLEKKIKPLNIDLLLQSVMEKWDAKCKRNYIEVVYQCQGNLPMVAGDMRSLEQVFTNLISNAIEAMKPQGGGTMAIKVEQEDSVNIRVNVSDNGPGIPEEILHNLFTPFVSFSLKGTGLGLAITKELVEAQNGKISVESFPGGTVFHVILPIAGGDNP